MTSAVGLKSPSRPSGETSRSSKRPVNLPGGKGGNAPRYTIATPIHEERRRGAHRRTNTTNDTIPTPTAFFAASPSLSKCPRMLGKPKADAHPNAAPTAPMPVRPSRGIPAFELQNAAGQRAKRAATHPDRATPRSEDTKPTPSRHQTASAEPQASPVPPGKHRDRREEPANDAAARAEKMAPLRHRSSVTPKHRREAEKKRAATRLRDPTPGGVSCPTHHQPDKQPAHEEPHTRARARWTMAGGSVPTPAWAGRSVGGWPVARSLGSRVPSLPLAPHATSRKPPASSAAALHGAGSAEAEAGAQHDTQHDHAELAAAPEPDKRQQPAEK